MDTTYPRAGTLAERLLEHIEANPGISVNGLLRDLQTNPSPTRQYLKVLLDRELIEDRQDSTGHHYYATNRA